MGDFKRLAVWRKAHELTLAVYRATAAFPDAEKYALTNQMRRASMSIPTNIAEGCGRNSDRELARFLRIAKGSATELEYQILLSRDLGFLAAAQYDCLAAETLEIQRMLASLIRQLKQTTQSG
jgi:four helix bundle protein